MIPPDKEQKFRDLMADSWKEFNEVSSRNEAGVMKEMYTKIIEKYYPLFKALFGGGG